MKRFTALKQKIGKYGEDICVKWLENNNYTITERNFTTRSGEIDIIAQKTKILHFIEVKSIINRNNSNVTHETYNPAENMTKAKISKCYSVIHEYKQLHKVTHETQLDLYMVFIDNNNRKHRIKRIENIF
ncbi:MAG: YraN family protein [Candidatus Pacebacteria bacterium]|nr:YraN family protein [Candidatus Paceibacterota bacterium]